MDSSSPEDAFELIRNISESQRPREKLQKFGAVHLTEVELLAILLNTGIKGLSVLNIAKSLYDLAGNDLKNLSSLSLQQIQNVKGIGVVKGIKMKAALELVRRNQLGDKLPTVILSPTNAAEHLRKVMLDLPHEVFFVLCLSNSKKVLKTARLKAKDFIYNTNYDHHATLKVAEGTSTGVQIELKKIFEILINTPKTTSFIIAHNHPSGTLKPSISDINLTKKVKEASKIMDIELVDHIIITDQDFYSFADNDLL